MAEPVGPTAAAWLAGPDATFEEALLIGRKEAEEAAAMLPTLPRRDASRYLPVTASDAVSLVHAREDAKKKNAGNKVSKVKQKQGAAALFGPDGRVPGAAQGGGDPGAFWLYVEDFFRDATQEDLHEILSLMAPPESDSAFAVGPPGSGADVPPPPKRAAEPPPPPPPPPPALGSLVTGGDAGAPADEALLGLLERRSSRLVSRLGRGGSGVARFLDGDESLPDTEDEAPPPENKTTTAAAAAAAAVAATAMRVPTTAAGIPASTLWEVVPGDRLAALALQLGELAEAAGVSMGKPLPAGARSAATAAAAGRRALSASETSQIVSWIESRTKDLSNTLHCTQDIALLGLRRRIASEKEGSEAEAAEPAVDAVEDADGDGFPQPTTTSLPFAGQVHPYTRLMLQSRVPPHVQASVGEAHGLEPAAAQGKTPNAEHLTAADATGEAGAGPGTAAASADGRGAGPGAGGDTAATSAAPGQQPTPPATAANSSMAATEAMDVDGEGGGEDDATAATGGGSASRPGSGRASARQRGVSNYALLAGKKDPAKAAAAAAQRKLIREATAAAAALQAASHPVSLAVASAVAEGALDDEMDPSGPAQWAVATSDTAVLAAAPQDELAAETVALQAELAAVAAANRASLTAALRGLLADLPRQAELAAARATEEADVIAYYTRLREEKKKELKQRREAAHREALVAAGAQKGGGAFGASPRPTLGHHLPVEGDGGDDIAGAPFLGPEDLYDVLAARGEDDEAFCAVCGDGHSEAPNAIIFCDRCDVAVHQMCYDVPEVPESEWLCHPCREFEEAQRAAGVPQAEIRPPHALPDERRRLRGGARDVKCALCPIRCGAFRKTANGEQWVHPTCALWHDECFLRPGPQAAVVEGLNKIPTKRWQTACDICGRVDGAVINCRHPGTCQYNFHVLCARNCGLYLTVRPDGPRRAQYRVYCAQHSRAQKEKDAMAAAKRAEGEQRAAVAAAERASKARRKEEAMITLAKREEELDWLRRVRFNLESARVLADQCKRRERLKKMLVTGQGPLHAERLQNPLAALAFLSKLEEMEAAGATPGQQLAAVPELAAAAGPPPPPPPPSAVVFPPPAPAAEAVGGSAAEAAAVDDLPVNEGDAAAEDAAMAEEDPASAEPSAAERRSARNASKRGRDEGGGGDGTGAGPSPAASSPLHPDGGGAHAKRQRTTSGPASGGAAPGGPSRSGTAPAIERQLLLSSSEARDINSKLPPKFKYVPLAQLNASGGAAPAAGGAAGAGTAAAEEGPTGSTRARRAAARDALTAGSSPAGPSPAPSEGGGDTDERPNTRRAAHRN